MGKSEMLVIGDIQAVGECEVGIQPWARVSHYVDVKPGDVDIVCHCWNFVV